jgi:hypothetical protein
MMTEKEIRDAYRKIHTIDNTIPDNVLVYMKDAAIEKLNSSRHIPNNLTTYRHANKLSYSAFCKWLNAKLELSAMKKVPTLHFIEFNMEERKMICFIINHLGEGQHPVCDETTLDGFMTSYLKDILNKEEFKKTVNMLSPLSKQILAEIQAKL